MQWSKIDVCCTLRANNATRKGSFSYCFSIQPHITRNHNSYAVMKINDGHTLKI